MRFKKGMKTAAVFLVIIAALTSVCACSGARRVNRLLSYGMYSEKEIILPIKSYAALEGMLSIGLTSFQSKQSPETLLEIIKGLPLADVRLFSYDPSVFRYTDTVLIQRENGDGTADFFGIVAMEKRSNRDYGYRLHSMRCEVTYEDAKREKASFWLLMPLHLFSDYKTVRIYTDMEYAAAGTLDDFYAFYEKSGWFETQLQADGILIKGFKSGVEIRSKNAELPFSFKIVFRKNVDRTLFKIIPVS